MGICTIINESPETCCVFGVESHNTIYNAPETKQEVAATIANYSVQYIVLLPMREITISNLVTARPAKYGEIMAQV
jgi:hypothetical protein